MEIFTRYVRLESSKLGSMGCNIHSCEIVVGHSGSRVPRRCYRIKREILCTKGGKLSLKSWAASQWKLSTSCTV